MLENYGSGCDESPKMSKERCTPNYEEMILRLKKKMEAAINFRDSALEYFKGKQARGAMAELIGELVTQCAQLELELASLVKRQQEDS